MNVVNFSAACSLRPTKAHYWAGTDSPSGSHRPMIKEDSVSCHPPPARLRARSDRGLSSLTMMNHRETAEYNRFRSRISIPPCQQPDAKGEQKPRSSDMSEATLMRVGNLLVSVREGAGPPRPVDRCHPGSLY